MATRKEIRSNSEYWMETVQGEVYRLVSDFMQKNNLNQSQLAEQLQVSSSYVSQILNGNFNYTVGKLVSLALSVDHVPILNFMPIDEYLNDEKYPENKYRYTSQSNSDGGCFVDIPLKEASVPNVDANKLITIKGNHLFNSTLPEFTFQ